jgi:hypothetical protein
MAAPESWLAKLNTLRARRRWQAVRPAADALAALALFTLVTVTIGAGPTSANPHIPAAHLRMQTHAAQPALGLSTDVPAMVEIATTSSSQAPDAVYRRTSATAAWLLLSLAFSLLIAFNMAILRHMRRAYAPKCSRPNGYARGNKNV